MRPYSASLHNINKAGCKTMYSYYPFFYPIRQYKEKTIFHLLTDVFLLKYFFTISFINFISILSITYSFAVHTTEYFDGRKSLPFSQI